MKKTTLRFTQIAFGIASVLAMSSEMTLAQSTWQPTSFTYNPADTGDIMELGSRRVFASPYSNTVITAYSREAGATKTHISMDGGTTWNHIFSNKPLETPLFLPNGNILLATEKRYLTTFTYVSDSLFRSTDGINWSNLGTYDNKGSDKGDYAVSDNNQIFIPRNHGINGPYFDISSDNGDSWVSTGYLTGGINSVAVSSSGDTIIVGNTDGVRYSHDGGTTWGTATGGAWGNSENGCAAILPNGDVYVAGPGKIYKSTDGGQTFSDLTPNPWIAMTGINYFHYHEASGKFFIKNGPYGMWESTDCITWTNISGNLPGMADVAYSQDNIYAIYGDTLYRYAIQPTTNVSENAYGDIDFQIYPNPAKDKIIIDNIPPGSTLLVMDMAGKLVYAAATTDAHITINTEGLIKGVYLIQVKTKDANMSKKFIIAN